MKTKTWAPLVKGDLIDLIAPGFACSEEELEGAIAFIQKQGFVPRWNPNILSGDLIFAATDRERLEQLTHALTAADSRAVWCVRGGYGSIRLLPKLDQLKKPARTKLFVGISDITSLHIYIQQRWGWQTLHAPLMDRLGRGAIEKRHLKELMSVCDGTLKEVAFKNLKPLNEAAMSLKETSAIITGGNLTVCQSTLGTPYQIQTRGRFLFIEDLGERAYRVDRIMEQFRQAGLFKGIKGLLIGDFLGGKEPGTEQSLVPEILRRWAHEVPFPVIGGLPCGHADIQRVLPLGTKALLQGGRKALLRVQSGAKD